MLFITKPYLPELEEYIGYLEKIWETGQLTNQGNLLNQLEKQLTQYLQAGSLQYVTNGTIALQLAIKALDIQGEIITTPFSYVATTNAIIWENCTPIFVDIEDKTFCINPDKIEAAITRNTKAILATHVYGYPCDVKKIEIIAKKYNLKVIYDAAHCFGVKLNGTSILNYGDISTISFHATKLFHTVEGGAISTSDPIIANRISLLKKFGHVGEEEYYIPGINAKNSEFHAAMGLCILPKVNDLILYRKELSEIYDDLLGTLEIQFPSKISGLEYNYAYYPVVFENHQKMLRVREALMENQVLPRRYFFPSLNTLSFVHKQSCPVSEDISEKVLCLPLYFGLYEEDVYRISNIIKNTLQ